MLPRQQPPPKVRGKTKWDKFAEEKGIHKRKRGRLVWDEITKEWRPRHGYKRVGSYEEPIIEHSSKIPEGSDPFAEAKAAKRQRVAENLKKARSNAGLPNVPEATKNIKRERKREHVRSLMQVGVLMS